MARIFVGLGANLGDASGTLIRALDLLGSRFPPGAQSPLYRSKPLLDSDQPDFFNAVFRGGTDRSPLEVLDVLQAMEKDFGRQRDPARPKGPRTLDLDLLLYDDLVIELPRLRLPHAGIRDREFVLRPLVDLDPEAQDPETLRAYREILENLPSQGVYLFRKSL